MSGPQRYKPWKERTEDERRLHLAESQRQVEFSDHPLTDQEVARFLKLPSTAAAKRLIAEGRIYSRWAEDVQRYKHRTELVPMPGEQWPAKASRWVKSSNEDSEGNAEDGNGEGGGCPG